MGPVSKETKIRKEDDACIESDLAMFYLIWGDHLMKTGLLSLSKNRYFTVNQWLS